MNGWNKMHHEPTLQNKIACLFAIHLAFFNCTVSVVIQRVQTFSNWEKCRIQIDCIFWSLRLRYNVFNPSSMAESSTINTCIEHRSKLCGIKSKALRRRPWQNGQIQIVHDVLDNHIPIWIRTSASTVFATWPGIRSQCHGCCFRTVCWLRTALSITFFGCHAAQKR